MAESTDMDDITQDLSTCSVCFYSFDGAEHVPKFLTCFHSICLQCLRAMVCPDHDELRCPLCRQSTTICSEGSVDALPTNQYALKFAKMVIANPTTPSKSWCLTCGCVAQSGCTTGSHCVVVDPNSSTLALMKQIVDLKRSFDDQMSDERQRRLSLLESRRAIHKHYEDVLDSIDLVRRRWKDQHDENQIRIAELISNNNDHVRKPDDRLLVQLLTNQKTDELESEYMKVLEENVQSIALLWKDELDQVKSVLKGFEDQSKDTIHIQVKSSQMAVDPSSSSRNQPEIKVISHLISSLILDDVDRVGADNPPADNPEPAMELQESPRSPEPLNVDELTFELTVQYHGEKIGMIAINPSTSFDPRFIKLLADFCYCSPKKIGQQVSKAKSETHLAWQCGNIGFRPSMTGTVSGTEKTRYKWDVGIYSVEKEKDRVKGWHWIFYLKDASRREKDHSSVLFGEVVDEEGDVIRSLSSWKTVNKTGLTMIIEAKYRNL